MIVASQAPSRLSLLGGGSDLPIFYEKHGGLVVSMAIDIYQRFTMFSENDTSKIGWGVNTVPDRGNPEFVNIILRRFDINDAFFKNEYDGVIEGGLGSSAAAAVNIVSAVSKRLNLGYDRLKIAETAWDIEVNDLGLFGGKQDQIASAFGGMNIIRFEDKIEVAPFSRREGDRLLPAMTLFYMGTNRKSATIQEGLRTLSANQTEAIKHLKDLAYKSIGPVSSGDVEKLGNLLDKAWEFKKKSNKGVTNPTIDNIYVKAKEYGAWGGKVCGAGGGGFLFFMVSPAKRTEFIEKMEAEGLIWYDFNVCYDGVSSRILPKEV